MKIMSMIMTVPFLSFFFFRTEDMKRVYLNTIFPYSELQLWQNYATSVDDGNTPGAIVETECVH
jgi:hypothetical protein